MKDNYRGRVGLVIFLITTGLGAFALAFGEKNLTAAIALVAFMVLFTASILLAIHIKRVRDNRPVVRFKGEEPLKRYFKEVKNWNGRTVNATLTVNAHFDPKLRAQLEKAVDGLLTATKVGRVVSGKCIYKEKMEVDRCELYLSLKYEDTRLLEGLAKSLDKAVPIPRGSLIQGFNGFCKVGVLSGLAVYFQVSKVPYSEEAQQDYANMIDKIYNALEDKVSVSCHWSAVNGYITKNAKPDIEVYGEEEPIIYAYYYYGTDFADMKSAVEPIIKESKFSDVCRLVQCS